MDEGAGERRPTSILFDDGAEGSTASTLHSLFSSLATPSKAQPAARREPAQTPMARSIESNPEVMAYEARQGRSEHHDEACFIDCVDKVDIITKAPAEIAVYIFTFLNDYRHVLAISQVSTVWRKYARDTRLWQQLFLDRAEHAGWQVAPQAASLWPALAGAYERVWQREQSALERKTVALRLQDLLQAEAANGAGSELVEDGITRENARIFAAPMHWYHMYIARQALTKRWGLDDDVHMAGTAGKLEGLELDQVSTQAAQDNPDDDDENEYRTDPAALAYVRSQTRKEKKRKMCEPEVRYLSGHSDSVYCVRLQRASVPPFSSTQSSRRASRPSCFGLGTRGRIFSGSRDRTIKIWDGDTEQLQYTLEAHKGSVLCLELEGETMLSGSSDQTVIVWSLAPMQLGLPPTQTMILRGHKAGVLDLAMLQRYTISCGKDSTVRVYDRSKDFSCVRIYTQHRGPVNAGSLCMHRDAMCAVTASGEGSIQLWQVESGALLRTFEGHSKGLACVKFFDNIIISGSNDYSIRFWNADTGACLAVCTDHTDLVRALAYDPLRKVLVSAGYDGRVKLFDVRGIVDSASLAPMLTEHVHLTALADLRRTPRELRGSRVFDAQIDASRVISCGESTKICIRDFARDSPIMRLFI